MNLLPAFVGAPELNRVYQCDALTLLKALPDASVDLIATDPPYNGVKLDEAWDNQWPTDAAYLEWLRGHLVEFRRVLKPNGSLYLFASPRMSARVEVLTGEYFNVLNGIVWNKTNGNRNWSADKDIVRGFLPNTERIVFAEQYNGDTWASGESEYWLKLDNLRGFLYEPIRSYLAGEFIRAGVRFDKANEFCGTASMAARHYFSRSQWCMPTPEHYASLQRGLNAGGGDYLRREYEDLRREYEDLRREYEDLRRPFNVSADVPYTDVWDFPTVGTYPGKHPCEKPLSMMRHIINASSRPGDVVLDCFCGSGATIAAAFQLGRQYIGNDRDPHWVQVSQNRCVTEFGGKRKTQVVELDDLPLFAMAAGE